ncbi:3'-5' exoribonuclease domain-containing protein [Dryocola clanedunensis]
MNTYAYLVKAKAKATEAKSLFCWLSAKSESRADREILNILEDNGIEVGRGTDHNLPVRTNWHVVDDLPEEGKIDSAWCDRYELAEDGLTWKKIIADAPAVIESVPAVTAGGQVDLSPETPPTPTGSDTSLTSHEQVSERPDDKEIVVSHKLPFNTELAHFWLGGMFTATPKERAAANAAAMDTDDSYLQNVLLALNSVESCKHCFNHNRLSLLNNIKKIWPLDGKAPSLNLILSFTQEWMTAVSDESDKDGKHRADVVDKWLTRCRKESTPLGATAGGNKTDRNSDIVHTLDTLDLEIALATLPMDFNIYDIPGGVYRRAKEIVQKNESPFKEWSAALRSTPGILDYSRAAIFALIRSAADDVCHFPVSLQTYINANLTESNHETPTAETLSAARHHPEESWENEINRKIEADRDENAIRPRFTAGQPEITSMGGGMFCIDGITSNSPTVDEQSKAEQPTENADNVQVEETHGNETEAHNEMQVGQTTDESAESDAGVNQQPDPLNNDSGHHIEEATSDQLYSHLMVDTESMGSNPDAPLISVGAIFFNPETGATGAEFYKVISLESAMAFGGKPDAGTILWWMKQSSEARSALLIEDVIPLDDALLQFNDFISENSANGPASVQLWGNGATFDNVLLRQSFERTGIPCLWKFWNDRDVRTIVALGKAVGIEPRYEIPFEGDQHNALADAHHQVKYVSEIWQVLAQI